MSKSKPLSFRFIKGAVRFFYPEFEVIGKENLTSDPCIIVGNHSQIHGPVACELFFPDNTFTWCAGDMMELKKVPAYAYKDFWSQKSKFSRPFYKLVSYIIAPLSVLIFKNARTIGVYHDSRILSTFKNTVDLLKKGNNIVIFPEHDKKHNNIIYDFQDRFIDVAKFYQKQSGKQVSFVPLYVAPKLKKMYIGKPIEFNANEKIDVERERICQYLMKEITSIATNLPLHTVVPYRNIKKADYPKNKKVDVK